MFSIKTYTDRRNELKKNFKSGILLFLGNNESPMNYAGNTYHFRQDSTFLYYWGINQPNLAAVINIDKDQEIIFGDDRSIDDIIWMGFDESISEKSKSVGVEKVKPFSKLESYLKKYAKKGKVHYLPQYRQDNIFLLEQLIGIKHNKINNNVSEKLIKAVIKQRSIKTNEEIKEIEQALDVSYEMNTVAMKIIRPGLFEREVYGVVEGIALSKGNGVSFPIIFSVNGEILHNHSRENIMKEGQIAVLDSGAETMMGYASDITRTIPVNGKFSQKQKDIYNIVLNAQLKAIELMKPDVKFKEIHIEAAKVITQGLADLGIMKGNINDAVNKGAHALFFPHGLGHMMGLDVHDMENLGENYVGYSKITKRSDQFGLAYLRLAKKLEPGFVATVEPGCYFIPALIKKWKEEKKHLEFINYDKVEEYLNFGGVRIEDNVLVTQTSHKVLGKPIPKSVEEVEQTCDS
ncbi:MAG: aminopeptidase P family protein [Ignavibacteriae bacterium]|nr:aminopeptidase P family protein [Ignavibacteriota bacterium]